MIRVKSDSVRLNFASEPLRRLVRVLAETGADHAATGWWTGDLVITSANDSRHGPGSKHYTNEAIDVRSHNFRDATAKHLFRTAYELALGPQFRVLLEGLGTPNEHFHAQVRKGHAYTSEGF